jgi:hypothetical protein
MRDDPNVNADVTFVCSYLSLIGSLLIILAYGVARTKSTPKSAFLILHLAISDFFWFLAASILATVWIANDNYIPDPLCYIIAPIINFTRMTSLIWTVAISFNVYMSVRKRKWFWKSQENDWENYRRMYFGIAFLFAAPNTIITIIYQHTRSSGEGNGCGPEYEPVGKWYLVLFTELLPIIIGFVCNIFVFRKIRRKMSKSAFPLSVRKRRKRVMYHYITICILCWIPTILLYILEISGLHLPVLEIVARSSLYISGFLNFLVFGMQDPHLKRAMDVIMYRLGCYSCCGYPPEDYSPLLQGRQHYHQGGGGGSGADSKEFYSVQAPTDRTKSRNYGHSLKSSDVEKMVMFQEETINKNADLPKEKNAIYKHRKLSKEQKLELYEDRPDLDPKFKIKRVTERKKEKEKEKERNHSAERRISAERKKKRISLDSNNPTDNDLLQQMETPLLEDYESEGGSPAPAVPVATGVPQEELNSPPPTANAAAGRYKGTPHPKKLPAVNSSSSGTRKKSLDGDRELNSVGVLKQVATTPPDDISMSFQSNLSDASNNSLTPSHDLSVLSDLTANSLLFLTEEEERDHKKKAKLTKGNEKKNKAIKDLLDVVHNDNHDEENPPIIPVEEREEAETTINVLHAVTNKKKRIEDSLNLHHSRLAGDDDDDDEEEEGRERRAQQEGIPEEGGEEEYEEYDEEMAIPLYGGGGDEEEDRRRGSQSSSNNNGDGSSSSEDEQDAEDEEFHSSPLRN